MAKRVGEANMEFKVDELVDIRERVVCLKRETEDPFWQQAYDDLACAVDRLHAMTRRSAADYTTIPVELVTIDPEVCNGKPCIRDTGIMASAILDCLIAGMPTEAIITQFPALSNRDVGIAVKYARILLDRATN